MALQKDYLMDTGADFSTAYFRVLDLFMSAEIRTVGFRLAVYKDKTCRDAGKNTLGIQSYNINDIDTPAVQATYTFDIVGTSGTLLTIDLTGNGTNEVTATMGTDFSNPQTLSEYLNTALPDFTASPTSTGVQLVAKSTGAYAGSKGNAVVISGTAVSVPTKIAGSDVIPSAFKQFFSLTALSANGGNPVSQAYLYLKSLSAFSTATDVI